MKKILVPVDFSNTSSKAVMYAAEISIKSGAILCLLHNIEQVEDNLRQPFGLHDKYIQVVNDSRKRSMDELLGNLVSGYPGIKPEIHFKKGNVIENLVDFATSHKVDLIVMGTKGANGLKEIFMGSVTSGVIEKSPVPVLAIPDEFELKPPHKLLFATNHFEENIEILDLIAGLASLFKSTIYVVVFLPSGDVNAAEYLFNTRQLNHYLEHLKKNYPQLEFKGDTLQGEKFEETIKAYDDKNEVDLIAMVTYPKSAIEKLLRKSVTKKMAFHSRIPLLAIPAKL